MSARRARLQIKPKTGPREKKEAPTAEDAAKGSQESNGSLKSSQESLVKPSESVVSSQESSNSQDSSSQGKIFDKSVVVSSKVESVNIISDIPKEKPLEKSETECLTADSVSNTSVVNATSVEEPSEIIPNLSEATVSQNVEDGCVFESTNSGNQKIVRTPRNRFAKPHPKVVQRTRTLSENEKPNLKTQTSENEIQSIEQYLSEEQLSSPVKSTDKRISKVADDSEIVAKKRTHYKVKKDPPPDRAKMTMLDLIFYNPVQNPMTYSDEKPADAEKVIEDAKSRTEEPVLDTNFQDQDEDSSLPGPRVMVGENGEIILDEQSLYIQRKSEDTSKMPVIHEKGGGTTYSSFRKTNTTKWTTKETVKFYKALSIVGTDFSLMSNFFPNRKRHDLKNKYKREERFNSALVDKAINESMCFNLESFNDAFMEEEEEISEDKFEESRTKRRKSKANPSYEELASNKRTTGRKRKAKDYSEYMKYKDDEEEAAELEEEPEGSVDNNAKALENVEGFVKKKRIYKKGRPGRPRKTPMTDDLYEEMVEEQVIEEAVENDNLNLENSPEVLVDSIRQKRTEPVPMLVVDDQEDQGSSTVMNRVMEELYTPQSENENVLFVTSYNEKNEKVVHVYRMAPST